MEVAALVLMAAGVGINYGWQPMPDGSSRYEYVVQIEPEMLAALAEDGSIPIVSEVPEHVRPIGRIRVVVGRGDLPRERLVKRMKPTGEAAAGSGGNPIELAQYNQFDAAGGRYGQQQPAAARQTHHRGMAAPPTPRRRQQRYGGAWNQDPISVAQRPGDQGPMARVGDSIDNATARGRRVSWRPPAGSYSGARDGDREVHSRTRGRGNCGQHRRHREGA